MCDFVDSLSFLFGLYFPLLLWFLAFGFTLFYSYLSSMDITLSRTFAIGLRHQALGTKMAYDDDRRVCKVQVNCLTSATRI